MKRNPGVSLRLSEYQLEWTATNPLIIIIITISSTCAPTSNNGYCGGFNKTLKAHHQGCRCVDFKPLNLHFRNRPWSNFYAKNLSVRYPCDLLLTYYACILPHRSAKTGNVNIFKLELDDQETFPCKCRQDDKGPSPSIYDGTMRNSQEVAEFLARVILNGAVWKVSKRRDKYNKKLH